MKEWFEEFKKFALRGNMVDLAIGIIIGTAFGKVVSSLVSDVIMPPLGLLIGGVDFSQFSLPLKIPGSNKPAVELRYGSFLNSLADFFIMAAAIFFIVKAMNRLRSKSILEDLVDEPLTKECPYCMMSIPKRAAKCGFCCSNLI